MDDIGRSCDDATGIVSDILDFDKIGEGKMTLEVAKVRIMPCSLRLLLFSSLTISFFRCGLSVAVQVPLAAFVADVLKPFDTAVKEKGLALCVVYDSEVRVHVL